MCFLIGYDQVNILLFKFKVQGNDLIKKCVLSKFQNVDAQIQTQGTHLICRCFNGKFVYTGEEVTCKTDKLHTCFNIKLDQSPNECIRI